MESRSVKDFFYNLNNEFRQMKTRNQSERENDDFYNCKRILTRRVKGISLGSVGSGVIGQIQSKKEIDENQ